MGARGAVRASLKESRATDVALPRQCFLRKTGGRGYWRAGFMDIAPRCPWHTIFSRWEGEPIAKNRVTTTAYPLYDTHGNMVATLTKNASGTSWNVGNEHSYDVWGGVRSGNASGGPKGGYCASLGHVQDDESGLIYMRARYYEPSTGRVISEDPAMDGGNWFVYGKSSPTRYNDYNGETPSLVLGVVTSSFIFFWGLIKFAYNGVLPNWAKAVARTIIASLIATTQYMALVEFAAYVNAGFLNPVAMHGAMVAMIGLTGAATVATLYAMMNFVWLLHVLAIDDATWEEFLGSGQMIDPEVLL